MENYQKIEIQNPKIKDQRSKQIQNPKFLDLKVLGWDLF